MEVTNGISKLSMISKIENACDLSKMENVNDLAGYLAGKVQLSDSNVSDMISQCMDIVVRLTKNRSASHGSGHARECAVLAEKIVQAIEVEPKVKARIATVAHVCGLLHDVDDHKYDPEHLIHDQLYNHELPAVFTTATVAMIKRIIGTLSWSAEHEARNAGKTPPWKAKIHDNLEQAVRHAVSDADKLLSIGVAGFDRTCLYSVERIARTNMFINHPAIKDGEFAKSEQTGYAESHKYLRARLSAEEYRIFCEKEHERMRDIYGNRLALIGCETYMFPYLHTHEGVKRARELDREMQKHADKYFGEHIEPVRYAYFGTKKTRKFL